MGYVRCEGANVLKIKNLKFDDPHHFEGAIRAADVQGFAPTRGAFSASLLQIDLGKLWLQSGKTNLAWSAHVNINPERSAIFFLADAREASTQASGVDIPPGKIVFWKRGSSHYNKAERPTEWASMSLSPSDLAKASGALIGRPMSAPNDNLIVAPTADQMSRLTALHARARMLAAQSPERMGHPEVAHALESALTHAMLTCLSEGPMVECRPSLRLHTLIMARFEELIAESAGRPLYLAEVCEKVGASESTLRRCCQEQVGMGPIHYLLMRRLKIANRHLLELNRSETTVANVATDLGFWELGRFAGAYRAMFGESPSATLRRSRGSPGADLVSSIASSQAWLAKGRGPSGS